MFSFKSLFFFSINHFTDIINVSEKELKELDKDRNVFPLVGMQCCITGCDNISINIKCFKNFMDQCPLEMQTLVYSANVWMSGVPTPI